MSSLLEQEGARQIADLPPYSECDGVSEIVFSRRNDRDISEHVYMNGNSRVSFLLPNEDNLPYHMLITNGGGFIEGEHYRNTVVAEKGSHAIVASQAPTYIYKCEKGGKVTQHMYARLEEGAFLELYMDEVIPYRDARFVQTTEIDMPEDSTLVLTDGLTSGWSPDGELFQYTQCEMATRVRIDGKIVYNDHLICNPEIDAMENLGFFEGQKVFNSCVVIDSCVDEAFIEDARKAITDVPDDLTFGISLLNNKNGAIMRILGREAQSNRYVMWQLIDYFREQVKGLKHLDLNKNDSFLR